MPSPEHEILNASDEIILDHVNKLQHGFDHVLQDNLHLMTDAGKSQLLWQLTLIENKIASLRFICETTQEYLKKNGVVKFERRLCPECKHDVVWGLYRNGVWSCTCERCGKVETTTDRAAAERLWVVTEPLTASSEA